MPFLELTCRQETAQSLRYLFTGSRHGAGAEPSASTVGGGN